MKKGQSTLGYGKTKAICLEARKQNLSIEETAEKYGLSVGAVRSCTIRNKIKLRNTSGRVGWGVVKNAIIEGIEKNMTYKEVAEFYGLKLTSVRRTCLDYGLKLKD